MFKSTHLVITALVVLLVSACELKDEDPEGVIPQGYKDAVNKAENVEGLLNDTQKQRLEDLDAANP